MQSARSQRRPHAARGSWFTEPLVLLTAAVLLCTLLAEPRLSAGVLWDSAQLTGYLTFALLLYSVIDTGLGPRQRLHRHFGYLATGLLACHGFGLLLTDPPTLHYLSWQAPGYMLAGFAALLLLILLVVTALPRSRKPLHKSPADFRAWHQGLSISILLLALWHILGSGFYLGSVEPALLAAVTLGIVPSSVFRVRVPTNARYATLLPVALTGAVFLLVKWIPSA